VRHPFPDTFRIGRQSVTRFLEADAALQRSRMRTARRY